MKGFVQNYKRIITVATMLVVIVTTLITTTIKYNSTKNAVTTTDNTQKITGAVFIENALKIARGDGTVYNGAKYYCCSNYIKAIIEQCGATLYNPAAPNALTSGATITYNGQSYTAEMVADGNKINGKAWYNCISFKAGYDRLEPGDVVVTQGHTFMYIGEAATYDELKNNIATQIGKDASTLFNGITVVSSGDTHWTIEGNVGTSHTALGSCPICGQKCNRPFIRNYNWATGLTEKSSTSSGYMYVLRITTNITNGSYNVKLGKKSNANPDGGYIPGAKIGVRLPGADEYIQRETKAELVDVATNVAITSADGYDNYVFREDAAPAGYTKRGGAYGINIYKQLLNNTYTVSHLLYFSGNKDDGSYKEQQIQRGEKWWVLSDRSAKIDSQVTDAEKKTSIAIIDLSSDGTNIVFTELDEPTGGYHMYINKQDYDTGNSIAGAEFTIKQTIDDTVIGTDSYTEGNTKVISKDGPAYLFWEKTNSITKKTASNNFSEVEIKNTGTDTYEITEIKAPDGYTIMNDNPLKLQITKVRNSSNNGYEIGSIELVGIEGSKVNAPTDGSGAWLRIDENGNVIANDDDNYYVAIDFHSGVSGAIHVRFKDKKAKYTLDVDKKSATTGSYVAGANFDVNFYQNTRVEDYDNKIFYKDDDSDSYEEKAKLSWLVNGEYISDDSSVVFPTKKNYNLTSLATGGSEITSTHEKNPPLTFEIDGSDDKRDIIGISEKTAPAGYEKVLNKEILFAVHKTNGGIYETDSNGEYKLNKLELLDNDGRSLTPNVTITEGEFLNIGKDGNINNENPVVKITFSGNKITAEWTNPESTGDYSLAIQKINKDDPTETFEGISFTINGEKTEPTNSFGLTFSDDYEINSSNVNTIDEYTITEVDLGVRKGLVTLDEPVTIYVSKEFANNKYRLKSASFDRESVINSKEVKLKDGSKAVMYVDIQSNIVLITIPNSVVGDYNLKIGKKPVKDNKYIGIKEEDFQVSDDDFIEGAKFTVVQYLNSKTKNVIELADEDITATAEDIESKNGEATQIKFNGESKIDINDTTKIDIYKITETQAPEGYSISSRDPYYLKVYKELDETELKYVVKKIQVYKASTWDEYNVIYVGTIADDDDGEPSELIWGGSYGYEKFRVDLDKSTGTITFVMGDPEIGDYGSYKFMLQKKGSNGRALEGVKFTAKSKVNGAESYTDINTEENPFVSSSQGSKQVGEIITIDRNTINTPDEYVIKEFDMGEGNNDFYLGIDKEIKVSISKQSVLNQAGNTYINSVSGITLEVEGVDVTNEGTSSYFTLDNGTKVTVEFNKQTNTITMIVTNPEKKESGYYEMYVVKKGVDGTQLAGVKFDAKNKVNGADDYTVLDQVTTYASSARQVGSRITINSSYIDTQDEWILKETDIGENTGYYIGLNKDIKVKVGKKSTEDDDGFTITNSADSVELEIEGENVQRISDKESTVTLDNGTKVTVKVTNSRNITVTVENPKVTESGTYKLNLVKKGIDGTQLGGVRFTAKNKVNGATDYKDVATTRNPIVTSATNSVQVGSEITIDKTQVSIDDEWSLKEYYMGGNNNYYIGITKNIIVKVSKKSVTSTDGSTITNSVTGVSLEIEGEEVTRENEKKSTVTLSNGTVVTVELSTTNNEITVTVENPTKTESGKYKLNLVKKGVDGTQLGGVKFTAKNKVNGASDYTDIATEESPITTSATGTVDVGNEVTIDRSKISSNDEWVLKEFNIGNNPNYYIGLNKEITVKVSKKTETSSDGSTITNSVKGITLAIEGETVKKEDDTKSTVTLSNGTIVMVELNIETQTITVTVENPKVTEKGVYRVYLLKRNLNGTALSGVKFTAKRKVNGATSYSNIATESNPFVTTTSRKLLGQAVTMKKESINTPDEYVVKEFDIGDNEGYYIGIDKDIKISINKKSTVSADGSTITNSVTGVELEIEGEDTDRISDTESKVTLDNGTVVTVKVTSANTIQLTVDNPTQTEEGKYNVKLVKKGKDGTQLGGVKFTAKNKVNGAEEYTDIATESRPITTSATTSVAVGSEVTINKAQVGVDDEWVLKEYDIGNNNKYYIGIDKDIKIKVSKKTETSQDNSTITNSVTGVTLEIEGENVNKESATKSTVTLSNGTVVTVEIKITSNEITVTVENPEVEVEGSYNVNIVKYIGKTTTPVGGVEFEVSARVNGEAVSTIFSENDPLVTSADGPVDIMKNIQITKAVKTQDYFILNEKSVGPNTNTYVGLKNPIELYVTKKSDTSNPAKTINSVDEITLFSLDGRTTKESKTKSIINVNNGTKIEVEYIEDTKTIEIRATNPIKEGKFKVNLIKHKYNVDEDNDGKNDPLAGAKFDVTVKVGDEEIKKVTNATTGSNGYIPEITDIAIASEGLTYTITVDEVHTPEGYIGLGSPVTFTAKSKLTDEGYILDINEQPTIQNEYIQAEVKENEILIEAENRVEPVIHKGVKTVENQDSGYDKNEIQTWVINTTIPKGIKDYTVYNVTDTIDPEKTNVAEKRIAFINEDHPENNVVVKYKGTDTILTNGTDYKVAFDKTTKKLTVTFIKATEGNDNFVGGRSLTEDTTLEITYNTQFTLDSNGDPIGLNQRIPNKATLEYNGNGTGENKTKESEEPEVHTGGLGVYKYDKETKKALVGAKFRLVRTKAEAEAAVEALWAEDQAAINAIDWVKKYNADGTVGEAWEVTTGNDGYAYFAGLEFGEDAEKEGASPKNEGVNGAPIYNYDWTKAQTTYYLVETYVPEDYVLLEDVAAECVVKKDSFVKTDLTTYHKVGNELVVPEGEYALEIVKYGKYENEDPHPISGVVFSAKRKINGLAEEDLGNLTETDSTGRTVIGEKVTIDKDKVNTADEYTIHEVSIPETSEYYVGLEKDIKLTVSKQSVKSEDKKKWLNSVTGINMSIEGTTVTEVVAGKKYTAIVTKDGQELEVTAELLEDEEGGQYIKLTVEDPHKVGDFKLNIIKTIKGTNPEKPLSGTGFKVSIKNGNEALVDGNGKVLDGTNEFFVNDKGELVLEDLNIKKPGLTYDVEIEESTVPTGYIGISDNIKFSVVSKVKGAKLGLEDKAETKISNDVVIKYEDDEIWVDVENKPEPVIHKGVRSIRNQDAGYDGDEIQTWVINSTIEAGIEDYTQYIITDEIDFEKSNVEEKRIEYIPGSVKVCVLDDYEGNKVKDLVENTDYTVNFDDEKKIITITFISVDGNNNGFKAGRNLPAGNIIDIRYNTKFRLDENGLIIGLQQTIKNEATLTFGVRNHEDKEKKSETPEVHTGAVGVIKYEDVNKNKEFDDEDLVLEGAHFKIVRTKEEADKALAAVIAGDEETLKTISFVKVRDEEGNVTDVDVELITDDHGKAIYEGLEFGENASDDEGNRKPNGKGGFEVYEYDWENAKTEYYLVETEAPYDYYLMDHYDVFEVSKDSLVMLDESTYYKEADKPKIYDLSLRKFITHVNGIDHEGNEIDRNITDRIPRVTLTDEFKDKENDEVTTAIYEHTKEPVIVQQGNTVTYTIRVYNEGPEDAYASIVKDDIPDGVEFIKYAEGDGSINDTYRWKLVDENDNEVSDVTKAKYIVTDYLSMEQGEVKDGVNSNLLKGYDSDTMKELDYRDLKVQFYVTEPNTSERIITNYAQISEMTNSDGKIETDRDSTPNEWIEGEDDQDVEHIRLLYFDLALRKWVTKAIVTSDGEEKVFETGHKAEDDPEDVVKVDLKKSKLDKVVVKFEYQIRITNEGRIGGWCDEITDHIPDGLTFDQADNPIWTVVNDKTITTDALKDTYLEPGESAEVTVVLRWENSGDNLGIKVNVAEISKDRNEYGVHDIDSTPGNYKWGEDDIDDAPVMLAVTTGNMVIGYTILGLVVVSIITVGAIAIKKVRSEVDYF